jgi:sRNA-binding protein
LLGRDAVSTTGTTKLRLMNIEGRVVKTAVAAPGTSVIKVKTGNLATGAYVVEVFNDAGRIVRQAIKN